MLKITVTETQTESRQRDCLLAISQLRAAVERNRDEKEERL